MEARATVTMMDNNLPLVQAWVKSLSKVNVFIGVTDDHDERDEGGIGNVALANILENGAPASNIPPRPFMKPAIQEMKPELREHLKRAAQAMYKDKDKARGTFNYIGRRGVAAIRRKMESNIPPPLRPDTIRRRRKEGVRRTNTLIFTRQLWKAISYRVRGI